MSILREAALETVHDNVEDCPVVMEPGDAVKLLILGNTPAGAFVVNVLSPDTAGFPAASLDVTR